MLLLRLWARVGFSQKAGGLAAFGVLISAQIALGLSLVSQHSLQEQERAAYARAILKSVASRTSGLIASGDLLTVSSELNRLTETDLVASAGITDVEGNVVMAVGEAPGTQTFQGPLMIGPDLAGTLTITLSTAPSSTTLFATITGLSFVLALFLYGVIIALSREYTNRLWGMFKRVSQNRSVDTTGDPVDALDEALSELPLDLIDLSEDAEVDDTALTSMAVMTLSLDHLPRYIETVDEMTLVGYVATYETILKAIGEMLGGDSQSIRQRSLSLVFEGQWRGMSPGLRASVGAALLQQLLHVAERSKRLKFACGVGVGCSDLARGERRSAYASLYVQSTFDEALAIAQRAGTAVKLAPSAQGLSEVEALFDVIDTADGDCQLGQALPSFLPELDKQSRLLQRRLFPDVGEQSDLPF